MKITHGLDEGPYMKQVKVKIEKKTNSGELKKKLSSLGAQAIIDSLKTISLKGEQFVNQDESKSTYAKKIVKSETKIDWSSEAKYILGKNFKWIYGLMFKIVTKFSIVIVCHRRLFDPKKSHEITPSRLNNNWIKNCNLPNLDKPRLLYVGRINPEKGIDNFIKLFNKMNTDSELFIAGSAEKFKNTDHKIKSLGYISSEQELIRTYDHCNITILPSYTEAHPYVLEESLSRKRPIIIFEDIAYVKKNKKGVYIIKRDSYEIKEQIEWILRNYQSIQKEMDQNDLPTMQKMVKQFSNILQ